MPQRPQICQTRGVLGPLVTPAFFNYQILESTPLEKFTLFIVMNDSQRPHIGENTASVAIGFVVLLVHKSYKQSVRDECLPLC